MICKIVVVCAVVAICNAASLERSHVVHHEQPKHEHDQHGQHGHHGHAVSSQSFVLHHSHSEPQKKEQHYAPVYHHAPVHHAPVHHAPIHHAPVHHTHESHHKEEEKHAHPAYHFSYSVHDDHTKDQKSQSESRDGDVVKGEYQLLQPDGHIRTVKYTADKHSGFIAHVTYSDAGHHQGQAQGQGYHY